MKGGIELLIKELYETYKNDIYYYLLSLTHNSHLSEDLTSETFLGAITSIHTFRGEADIKTWLFSIARYKWYEYLRKRKEEISFEELAETYIVGEDAMENRIHNKEVAKRCLDILNEELERTRSIVMMRIEGYSYHEIALKFGISESSARVIDFRAKKKIQKILEKEGTSHE